MERLVEVKQVGTGWPSVNDDCAKPPVREQNHAGNVETRAIPAQADTGAPTGDRPASAVGQSSKDSTPAPDSVAAPDSAARSDGANTVVSENKSDSETTPDSRPSLAQAPDGAKAGATDGRLPAADQRRDRASVDSGGDGEGLADDPYYLADVGFWDRVVELKELWQRHIARWPDGPRKPGADRAYPDDPPGSWRGDGDRYLSPEDNVEADRLISGLREPEKAVTGLLQEIEGDSKFGGHLVGLDHRLKGDERLKEKIVDKMGAKGDISPVDAVSTINDAVRYTFCIDTKVYVQGYGDLHERLESAGCRMVYRRNHWLDDPGYKGINSRWETSAGGRFELQFHTKESFYAKEDLTHPPYERLRSPSTSRAERRELRAFQRQVAVAVPGPQGVDQIQNYGVRKING